MKAINEMVNIAFKKFLLLLILLLPCEIFAKRLQIRAVGSTTVYPFSTKVSEAYSVKYKALEPIIVSTGTGQGMALFCAPHSHKFSPDFTVASRSIKKSEINMCRKNGVGKILEVPFGYDGIILGIKKGQKNSVYPLKNCFWPL